MLNTQNRNVPSVSDSMRIARGIAVMGVGISILFALGLGLVIKLVTGNDAYSVVGLALSLGGGLVYTWRETKAAIVNERDRAHKATDDDREAAMLEKILSDNDSKRAHIAQLARIHADAITNMAKYFNADGSVAGSKVQALPEPPAEWLSRDSRMGQRVKIVTKAGASNEMLFDYLDTFMRRMPAYGPGRDPVSIIGPNGQPVDYERWPHGTLEYGETARYLVELPNSPLVRTSKGYQFAYSGVPLSPVIVWAWWEWIMNSTPGWGNGRIAIGTPRFEGYDQIIIAKMGTAPVATGRATSPQRPVATRTSTR